MEHNLTASLNTKSQHYWLRCGVLLISLLLLPDNVLSFEIAPRSSLLLTHTMEECGGTGKCICRINSLLIYAEKIGASYQVPASILDDHEKTVIPLFAPLYFNKSSTCDFGKHPPAINIHCHKTLCSYDELLEDHFKKHRWEKCVHINFLTPTGFAPGCPPFWTE